MNKITKYITTSVASVLLLISVGVIQPNANASRYYRVRVSRHTKKNVRRNNKRQHRNKFTKNNKEQDHNQKSKHQKTNKKLQAKAKQVNKRNQKNVRKTIRRYRKNLRKHNTRRNKRTVNRYTRRINRYRYYHGVRRARYRVVKGNIRGNRALTKADFYDGYALVRSYPNIYDQSLSTYVFSKYAPFDKRAVIPSYMDPRTQKRYKHYHFNENGYRNINKYIWVVGNFNPLDPFKNTKNPKSYSYNKQAHGWQLAKRY